MRRPETNRVPCFSSRTADAHPHAGEGPLVHGGAHRFCSLFLHFQQPVVVVIVKQHHLRELMDVFVLC